MGDTPQGSRVGSKFGHYILRGLLGRGGMSEVYEAEDTEMGRTVALKLLPESLSNDPVFRKRLKREAHAAGQLHEPHVVPIHGCGEIDGRLYVDMRLIDGSNLRTVVDRIGPLDPARAVAIVRQIASALDAAHTAGVTHRDVKPENILIAHDDFACLVDFGIANAATDEKLTQLGTAVGTHAYMAPERFTSDDVTYRADIYSLACVLYECLTGLQPYEADGLENLIAAHLYEPIPRPSQVNPGVPAALDDVIARGMAKQPRDRFAAAGDLAVAAQRALTATQRERSTDILHRNRAATVGDAAAFRPPLPPAGGPTEPVSGPTVVASGPAVSPPPGVAYGGQPSPVAPASGPALSPPPGLGYGGSPPPGVGYGGSPPPGVGYGGPAQQAPGPYYPPMPPWGQIPPGSAQPPAPPPKKRKRWPIAVALVGVTVIAAGAVLAVTNPAVLGLSSSSGTTTPTTTSTTSATSSTSSATSTTAPSASTGTPTSTAGSSSGSTGPPTAAEAKLISLAAADYGPNSCHPERPALPNAVATIGCSNSPAPGGPSAGIYASYGDRNALATAFHNLALGFIMSVCRQGGEGGEHSWHHNDAPNTVLGTIACGTFKGTPAVVWTNDGQLLLSTVQGANLSDLYTWWTKRTSP